MVQITKFAKDIISIERVDNNYQKTWVYQNIKADVQLRAYNIRDFSQEWTEVEATEKYYIILDKTKINVRPWDYIYWLSPMWINKTLLVTSVSVERFIKRQSLVEVRAKDYE